MTDTESRILALEMIVACLLTRLARRSAVPDVWMTDFRAELESHAADAILMGGKLGDAARRGVDIASLIDHLLTEAAQHIPDSVDDRVALNQ